MGGKLKIKLVEDGKGDIDEVYQELSEQHSNFFSDRLISEPDMLLHKNNEIKTSKQRQKQMEAFAIFLFPKGTSLSSHTQKPSLKIESLRTRIFFPKKCGIVHKRML